MGTSEGTRIRMLTDFLVCFVKIESILVAVMHNLTTDEI